MLILIEDTERGPDIAIGLWGAFNSCLYIDEGVMETSSMEHIIYSCARSGVSLIVVTDDMERLKNKNPQAFCIHCDGGNIEDENDKTLVFVKEDKRDNIVTLIITHLKRKKLL